MLLKKWKRYLLSSLLAYSALAKAGIDERRWYRIKPMNQDNLCYDVENGSDEDRAQVILYERCTDHRNQQFQFRKAATNPNAYYITPRHAPAKILDICEGSTDNRTRCILYHNIYFRGYGRHQNQEFYVTRVCADLYRITNVQSGMPLGFDENRNVCQMMLDYSHDTLVQLEEVN